MKTFLFSLSCFLFVTFFSTLSAFADPIRIGVSTALTGGAASYGTDIKNSLLFANEKLAGGKYELLFEDDKCNGRDAVSVAHRFISVLKVPYVMGFACSGTVFPTAPLYEKADVYVMIVSASAPKISEFGDHVFRTWPSDVNAGRELYSYIATHHKSVGIFSEQTDYAQGLADAFTSNNNDNRLAIETENYLPEASDFRSLLLRLRAKHVESLFINSQTELTFLAILKQVQEMHWDVPLYGAYWPGTKTFLEKAGKSADGIIFVDLPSVLEVANDEGKKLYQEFSQKYGNPNSVDLMFATSFEAFRAFHEAIESRQKIGQFLSAQTFHGIFGDWSFDENGDIRGLSVVMKKVIKGKVVTLPK